MSLHDIPNQMLKNISHQKQEIEGYDNYRFKQQSISESLKFLEQSPINSEREIEISLKSLISRATVEELLRIKFFIKKRDYLLKVQQSLTTNVFSQISTNKHSIIESFFCFDCTRQIVYLS